MVEKKFGIKAKNNRSRKNTMPMNVSIAGGIPIIINYLDYEFIFLNILEAIRKQSIRTF